MACHLFDTKLLSEPVLGYCQLDPSEQASVKFDQNAIFFSPEYASEYIVCEMATILSGGDELRKGHMIII